MLVSGLRVQVTAEFLLYGEAAVIYLERQLGKYTLGDSSSKRTKSFLDILVLPNTEEIILFEEKSFDLVKYNYRFEELNRLKGNRLIDYGIRKMIKICFTN